MKLGLFLGTSFLLIAGLLVVIYLSAGETDRPYPISDNNFFTQEKDEPHPTDGKMIERFHERREDLENLLKMFNEDESLGRVAFDFTRTSNFFGDCKDHDNDCWKGTEIEVTEERLAEYRKLFLKIGLRNGISGYGRKETVVFHATSRGLSITGSSKGYWHTTTKPTAVVEDLDKYWSPDGKSFTALRHIEGNWYLYFDYED